MSLVLYYNNFCQNSGKILQILGKEDIKNKIHFMCIDKRIKKSDGATYIILNNQKEVVLPPNITKVPALLLLNRGGQVLLGDDILNHLKLTISNEKKIKTQEPEAFFLGDVNNSGVFSDCYSFLDQTSESLSAKGDGGLRQIRNNATLEYKDSIETPNEDYTPNKIGEVSLDEIQQERQQMLNNRQ